MLTSKVSIIIPNYNHAKFLKQRLDSVFHQTYQNFEVILLDDASTDGSEELLNVYKNHPKVSHVIINKENSGSPFKQWKKGIDLAKGDYVWIAESDDYCELNFLEEVLQDNFYDVMYVQSQDINFKGLPFDNRLDYTKNFNPNIWESSFSMEGKKFIETYLLVKNVIPNASAVVFSRELINSTFFNSDMLDMKMCGDWLFWIKILKKAQIKFHSQKLNYFRQHDAVSRFHSSKNKKLERLLEEKVVRQYLFENLGVFEPYTTENMYNKWFKLHGKKQILSHAFYNIKLPNLKKITFLVKALNFKIKSKLN